VNNPGTVGSFQPPTPFFKKFLSFALLTPQYGPVYFLQPAKPLIIPHAFKI
jgi:hypothetical protein